MSELTRLLGTIEPKLHAGVYAFTSVPPGTDLSSVPVLSTFVESEGVSVILPEAAARALRWPILFSAAWITLTVHSDLQSVGLTAAVSSALAEAQISCNVVAGVHHDHLFVPVARGEEAVAVLKRLMASASE
jgi:uncharacterized protein